MQHNDREAAARFSRSTPPTRFSATRTSARLSIRGESTPEGKPRFPGFSGRGGPAARAVAPVRRFEPIPPQRRRGAWRNGRRGRFQDILNSMFGGAAQRGARQGGGSFEYDTGGIGLDLDLNVA